MNPSSAGSWRLAVAALLAGLRHLGLGGYAQKELLAVDNELGVGGLLLFPLCKELQLRGLSACFPITILCNTLRSVVTLSSQDC